jgi:hypothetical protein
LPKKGGKRKNSSLKDKEILNFPKGEKMKRALSLAGLVLFLLLVSSCSAGPVEGIDSYIAVNGVEVKVTSAKYTTSYTGTDSWGITRKYTAGPDFKFIIIGLETKNTSIDKFERVLNCYYDCYQIKGQKSFSTETYRVSGNSNALVVVLVVYKNTGNSAILVFNDGTEVPLEKFLSRIW